MSTMLEQRGYKVLLLAVDLCLIFLAYIAAFFIRYNEIDPKNWESFIALSPWILLISLFFLAVYDLYTLHRKSNADLMRSICVCVIFMAFLTMSASFLFRQFALPRSVILIASCLMIIMLIVWKITFKRLTERSKSGPVLLIGDQDETEKLISQIKHPLLKGTKVKNVHPNTDLERIYQLTQQADYVLLCHTIAQEKKTKIMNHAMKRDKIIYVVPDLYELLLSGSAMTSLDDTMVMAVKPFGLSWDQELFKRFIDVTASFCLLALLLPLFLFIGLLMKLEEPQGKIIYQQKRVGKKNRQFLIYKFRSMIEGAENQTGPVLAKENDERITKMGRFMRATRIDELPQLINVLKGDMSLVGPRPERQFFIKKLTKKHQSYGYRGTVKPGITGYAQIMGKYSTDAEDKLRYDLYYIRNYSFWLDLMILLRTVLVLLDKTKAEGKKSPRKKHHSTNVSVQIEQKREM